MDNVYLFYTKYFGIGKKNQPKTTKADINNYLLILYKKKNRLQGGKK